MGAGAGRGVLRGSPQSKDMPSAALPSASDRGVSTDLGGERWACRAVGRAP